MCKISHGMSLLKVYAEFDLLSISIFHKHRRARKTFFDKAVTLFAKVNNMYQGMTVKGDTAPLYRALKQGGGGDGGAKKKKAQKRQMRNLGIDSVFWRDDVYCVLFL